MPTTNWVKPIGLWRWYINITITILDIIHRPVFYLKHDVSCRCFKQRNVNKIYRFVRTSQETFPLESNSLMLSIGLWRWYINVTIAILDIIYRPIFSETRRFGDWILSPETENISFYWTQISRFLLKTEPESSLWDVVLYIRGRTMDNAQDCESYTNSVVLKFLL
jgi:hypothetical protein